MTGTFDFGSLVRRTNILLAGGIAAATLATGAGTAYASLGKTVTVTVDGSQHKVHTFAGTVAGALDDAGIRYSAHDAVVPAAQSALHRGARVSVRHARELGLTIDGRQRNVWVLADSVGEALDQLGLGDVGAVLSASRSRRLPMSGFDLRVRLPHEVTVLVDGRTHRFLSTDATVLGLLARRHIRLARTDKISVPLATYPADGSTVRITRIRSKTVTERVAIPYRTTRESDSSLYQGHTTVVTSGRPGVITRVFTATYVDGKLKTKRLMSQRRTTKPRTAVLRVGTKPAPPQPQQFYGGGGSGLDWAALARCESGGNPRAVSSSGTYRGLYQFSISTWQSVGGSGDPINASSSEQTHRASILYQRSGRGPWPVCGRYL